MFSEETSPFATRISPRFIMQPFVVFGRMSERETCKISSDDRAQTRLRITEILLYRRRRSAASCFPRLPPCSLRQVWTAALRRSMTATAGHGFSRRDGQRRRSRPPRSQGEARASPRDESAPLAMTARARSGRWRLARSERLAAGTKRRPTTCRQPPPSPRRGGTNAGRSLREAGRDAGADAVRSIRAPTPNSRIHGSRPWTV